MALTDKQRRFVEEYLIDLNATAAYMRAYPKCNEGPARRAASRLLTNVDIQKCIELRRLEMAANTDVTPEKVLQRWWDLANVDANELVEYRRNNCRHCWGVEHGYQWTEAGYLKAKNEAEREGQSIPDCSGGFDFDAHRAPNPGCPECHGEGFGKIHVHDTRKLKGAARRLYAGVHQGKDGLKVLMADREKALDNIARHLGMFNDKLSLTVPGGIAVKHSSMTPKQIREVLKEIVDKV